MSAPIEGRVLCDAQAASCRCAKDSGHVEAGDPVHACDPRLCTGSWTGDFDPLVGEPFRPVTYPMGVGS